jgi:EAL domain-containing protein (putative c-di-GMP-specific phosphodiesterase class I)
VRAVLGLGRGLGLPVLAEGVETEAEMQFLSKELCDEVQGFLLGRPVEIKQFRHLTHPADANANEAAEQGNEVEGTAHAPQQRLRVVAG